MANKCYVCNKVKPIKDFYKNKSRKKGYENICSQCSRIRNINFKKNNPWISHYDSARNRCKKGNAYWKRGRRFLMTVADFKFLWFKDKAYLLSRLSIDRKDNDKGYTLENCQFIELSANISKSSLGHKASPKTLKKMRDANIGKRHSIKSRKKMSRSKKKMFREKAKGVKI